MGLADTKLADFRRTLDLNLVGAFLAIRTAIRLMSDGGSVVALSSLRGVLATAGLGSYVAAAGRTTPRRGATSTSTIHPTVGSEDPTRPTAR